MVEHLEKSGQFLTDEEHVLRLDDAYECSYIINCKEGRIGALKYLEHDDMVEIMQIQIDPDCQGKGLGKRVMHQVELHIAPAHALPYSHQNCPSSHPARSQLIFLLQCMTQDMHRFTQKC